MSKEQLQSIYQKHHERGKRYGYLYCHGERGPFLKNWIGTGKKVLDLGCRDGMLTSFYREGNEVIGADIDQKALSIIEKTLSIETLWLDLNAEWPFKQASFDVIVACEIMEHLFFLDTFLENVQKTLKKGGLFIGSVPNAFRLKNRLKFLVGKEYETDPTHVRQFSCHFLESKLLERFQTASIFPLKGKIIPLVPVTRSTPKWISRLVAKDLLWKAEKLGTD